MNKHKELEVSGMVTSFKLWPCRDLSHYFWLVHVFRDRGRMRKAYHVLNLTGDGDDAFDAIVMPMQRQKLVKGRWRNDKEDGFLGYALFSQTRLTMETVCHEAVHMATMLIRRHRGTLNLGRECDDLEEAVAFFTGRCAKQLNNKFHKSSLYRER
jgi:hypothetical protein